jgi:predicted DNA-binding WGR domain protein
VIKIRWENEARGRYYLVYLHRDLLGDWQLTRVWGRKGSALGQTRHDMVDSEQAGREMIKKIAIRRKQRGYRIREGNTETLPLSDDNE